MIFQNVKGIAGFTVVETMVFLAISSAMFATAIAIVGSQRGSTQFRQAVIEYESQVRDLLSDVQDGVFPATDQITCTYGAQANFIDTGVATSTDNCQFIGKFMQVGVSNNKALLAIHTLVGENDRNSTVDDVTDVGPTFFRSTLNPAKTAATEDLSIIFGLTADKVVYNAGSGNTVHGFGFIYSELGRSDGGVSGIGGNGVQLFGYLSSGSPGSLTKANFQSQLNASGSQLIPANKITVCLTDSTKKAAIEITSAGANANFNTLAECA